MEPFPVICETCHARLKVRSESAIGEIHGCPKCGSMVHIIPPTGWKASAAAAAAVVAAGPLPSEVPQAAPSFDGVGEMLTVAVQGNVPAAEAASPAAAVAVAPATASTSWSPLVLSAIVGSAVLAGGVLVVGLWPEGETAAVTPSPPMVTAAATPASEPVGIDVVPPGPVNPTAPKSNGSQAVDVIDSAKPASSEPLPAAPVQANDESAAPAEPPVSATVAAASAPAVVETPPPTAPDKDRTPILKFDPLDFDPTQLSLSSTRAATTTLVTSSVPAEPAGEVESAGEDSDAELESSDAAPPAEANPSVTVRLGPVAAAAVEQHKIAHRLALRLDSLEITDMPLARFLETVSDLAGVPITLDPLALELAGVSPQTTVSVKARDVALEKTLREALTQHRLDFIERNGQVIVALPDSERRITRDYQLKDLVPPGETDAARVRQTIETFVAPSSWQSGGGTGTIEVEGTALRVDQLKHVHHELLVFCERLRMARGLPAASRYPKERLSIESPYAKLEAKLGAKTTFTLLPWTRLADVVRHWEDAAGVTILVDWPSVAEVQLEPTTPIACSAIDRTWGDALDAILEPLNLGWYAVDGDTIQITSRDSLEHIERVEFYDVPKPLRDQFASDEALIQSLETELQGVRGGDPAVGITRMQLDASSDRLIVRGNPAVHRVLATRFHGAAVR